MSIYATNDLTIVDKAIGQDVVDGVVFLIESSAIFPTTNGFLKRVAYVMSKFGTDPDTFAQRNGQDYNGGIWQVDNGENGAFSDSKNVQAHPELEDLYNKIKDHFGIDWPLVTWAQCRMPIISGLTACLSLMVRGDIIPTTLEQQAHWWISNYNSAATKGTEQNFITDIKAMEKLAKCKGRMNMVIVLDGSGSIGKSNFDLAKQFVADLIGTFSLESVNLGFVMFSDESEVVFPLDSVLNLDQMKSKGLHIAYPSLGTETSGAILTAVEILKNATHLEGSPLIMAIFTDGQPNNPVTSSVSVAKAENISIFAVGIGGSINQQNLLEMANNDATHVFTMTNYETLSTSFDMLNNEACKLPQTPHIGKLVSDSIWKDEKRYFCYDLPTTGITVNVQVHLGFIRAFFSYIQSNPSAALNEGTITGKTYIPVVNWRNSTRVCITIEGQDEKNDYEISSELGNTETLTTSTSTDTSLGSIIDDPLFRIKRQAMDIAEKAFANNDNNYSAITNEICNQLSKLYTKEEWICVVGRDMEISQHQRIKSMFQIGFEMKHASIYIIVNFS